MLDVLSTLFVFDIMDQHGKYVLHFYQHQPSYFLSLTVLIAFVSKRKISIKLNLYLDAYYSSLFQRDR